LGVNVTEVPEQIFVLVLVILTDAETIVFTVIVNALLVAVVAVTSTSEVVISQVTMSPLANVLLEYVELFVPTFEPLIFH
jgi:hypothetical protein